LLPHIRPQDIVDILIMSFLVYQLYSWFKNTKALQVVIGLGFLVLLYVATKNLGLFMTSWILQELGTVLFILIIVIFQVEIRQALYRFSLLRNLFGARQEGTHRLDFMALADTLFTLANARVGALVVFQRQEPLEEYLLHGVPLDCLVSAQLIGTIFQENTPLHDGAVVISDNRITQASCHLPLSTQADLPQHLGTRHRAGLGLTERSDAVVAIVSEERGTVTLAVGGQLQQFGSPGQLSARLAALLMPPSQEAEKLSIRKRLFSNLLPKIVTVALVFVSWLFITARQGAIVTVTVPLKFHNLPEGLALTRSAPEEIEVQLKALSSLLPLPKAPDVVADINLARIRQGTNQLAISSDDLRLPLGVVATGISPSTVKVTADKKIRKNLLVKVQTTGQLPGGLRLKRMQVEPAAVAAEGPEHLLAHQDTAETEVLNLGEIRQSTEMTRRLLQPAPQISFLGRGEVRVRVILGQH
jgi:uncharacterized protein (TIGR00159 family)